VKEGDEIDVKVIDIDDTGRVRLSRKAVIMEAPDYDPAQYEGMGEDRGGRDRGGRGGFGGSRDRGGRGGGGSRGPRR
jgi:polyribonucleotide nucleotidyltransferase